MINAVIRELVRFGMTQSQSLHEAFESLLDVNNKLEPYQRYESSHPKKKPRGSIRRKRKEVRVNEPKRRNVEI